MARRKGARMFKFAVGFAGGIGLFSGAVALSNTVEDSARFTALKNFTSRAFAATVTSPNDTISRTRRNGVHTPPMVQWDFNWDKREPESLVRIDQTDNGKPSKEELKSLKPTATRHLFLIRHGHYFTAGIDDLERKLTPKGCRQAQLTGQRLAELNHPYTVLYNSTMTRAIETSNIIAKHLPEVPREECSMLREGAPILPEPPVGHWKPELKQFYEDGARIEAAFRKYFHRADVEQETDSYDVLVCHANVIRYFVCRALQFPPEAWLRMSLHHGSITWLSVRPSGRVALRTLGDSGHIPPEELSVS